MGRWRFILTHALIEKKKAISENKQFIHQEYVSTSHWQARILVLEAMFRINAIEMIVQVETASPLPPNFP
jgi:hypothetical protein